MADEATATTIDTSLDGTQSEAPRDQEPASNGDSTFSQEQLDAAVTEALKARDAGEVERTNEVVKKVKAKASRKAQATQPSKEETPTPKNGEDKSDDLRDEMAALSNLNRRFDRSSGRHADHLNEFQLDVMEGKFRSDKPEELEDWWTENLTDMGWGKPTTEPAQRDTASDGKVIGEEPLKKPNPAAVDNTAPAGDISWKQVTDPTTLTRAHIDQIMAEKGTRGGQRFIREMFERWGKTVRVVAG